MEYRSYKACSNSSAQRVSTAESSTEEDEQEGIGDYINVFLLNAFKFQPVREAQMEDPLTAWVCLRIRQMNPNIDADVFAPFLLGFESPNEVEE